MFSILKTSLTDKPWILQGEVRLRSLLGLKGLSRTSVHLSEPTTSALFVFTRCSLHILKSIREVSFDRSFGWRMSLSAIHFKILASSQSAVPLKSMKLTCAPPLTSLVFYKCITRNINRLRSTQMSFAALSFSLIAFSDLFP